MNLNKKNPLGIIYVISGPSGCGKTSLVHAMIDSHTHLRASMSVTTRPMRPKEQDHVHYHFTDQAHFETMIKNDQLLEHAKVFGHYYGTPRPWVKEQQQAGIDIILEIDWQGARQIREKTDCISVFILPPSKDALRQRLEKRQQDDERTIQQRLQTAHKEIMHYDEFDYLIVNDDFDQAVSELKLILAVQNLTRQRRQHTCNALLDELLYSRHNTN